VNDSSSDLPADTDKTLRINGVEIDATFAEAFDMKATRIIVTADDRTWLADAAAAMTGFASSVIACGVEMGVERWLDGSETPDGREGVAILAFAVSGSELEKQIPRRAGQCVLTCPTTALYAGILGDRSVYPKRVPLGKTLRYFGDGHQIAKVIASTKETNSPRRFWRVPVMDGEFVCEHDVPRVDGVGGGNFILLGDSIAAVTKACRAAIAAMNESCGIITPFPGGVTRSGSKVGSKYKSLFASTNDAYCPTLKHVVDSTLDDRTQAVLEIVIDGMTPDEVADSMRVGIHAACDAAADDGLHRISAGNYGGKLGRHHFHLHEVLA
tara:strand:+ start:958791 stop:959768 length:978 start_codon:yes stop_codon:yes gene_type:complete